jgi:hypothetical protein
LIGEPKAVAEPSLQGRGQHDDADLLHAPCDPHLGCEFESGCDRADGQRRDEGRNERFGDEEAIDRANRRATKEPQRERAGDAEPARPTEAGDKNADDYADEVGDRDEGKVKLADHQRERRGNGEKEQT